MSKREKFDNPQTLFTFGIQDLETAKQEKSHYKILSKLHVAYTMLDSGIEASLVLNNFTKTFIMFKCLHIFMNDD